MAGCALAATDTREAKRWAASHPTPYPWPVSKLVRFPFQGGKLQLQSRGKLSISFDDASHGEGLCLLGSLASRSLITDA